MRTPQRNEKQKRNNKKSKIPGEDEGERVKRVRGVGSWGRGLKGEHQCAGKCILLTSAYNGSILSLSKVALTIVSCSVILLHILCWIEAAVAG